ncbi:helix-turn-helix domain-containing protein [Pelistega indica]|uniref:helix-turn-helix domain-containing protein n=1 Tax=Pelistega indica TaxID=1414851 RepID=UPI0004264AD2|nr:helix-turn-helix transcriptional regulator [Pelistega indica]
MKTLRERLVYAIELAGIRQVDIAHAVGVSPASVNDWLSGKSQNIRGENLVRVAKLLRVDANWLATGFGSINTRWPFKKLDPEDFDHLPEDVLSRS